MLLNTESLQIITQPAFTCSKLTTRTLGKGVKYTPSVFIGQYLDQNIEIVILS